MNFEEYINSLNLDWPTLLLGAAIIVGCTLLASILGRFIFGKRSTFNAAITSAINLVFIYIAGVALFCCDAAFEPILQLLPMLQLQGNTLTFIDFETAHYTLISAEVLHLVVLAFISNLFDRWIPKGKHVLTWILFRIISIALSFISYGAIVWCAAQVLPADFLTHAPMILLCILAVMLLTGALKILVGLFLTTVNPLIAALYTFFFANIIGKLVTRAVFTAAIVGGIVYLMSKIGLGTILLGSALLIAYLPFLIVLLVLWYLVYRFL